MQFRLIYKGSLPAQGDNKTRKKEKHLIRKALHPQLRQYWASRCEGNAALENGAELERLATRFARWGFRFVPIVPIKATDYCSLDILFLRRDRPGNLVRGGGDIDNRIKVLFDGLKLPQDCNEIRGEVPAQGEDPLFCLLEDDKVITHVNITTDRLLIPPEAGEHVNEVVLVINVTADSDLVHTANWHNQVE